MSFQIYAFADEASPKLDGQLAALQRNGLAGPELRNVDGENVSDLSAEKAKALHRRLEDAGLRVWSLGSPIGKVTLDADFDAHMEKLRRTMETGQILGAENVRIFSFYLPETEAPEQYGAEVIDRLGKMTELAGAFGMTLCHENEKGIYGSTPERCTELLTAIPALQGVFDPANFVQCGVEVWPAWLLLRERIKYLHIKDALADGTVVPAGRGIGAIKEILADYSFRGGEVLTLEPHLAVFSGLGALERENEQSRIDGTRYKTEDEAFDSAVHALNDLIKELEK